MTIGRKDTVGGPLFQPDKNFYTTIKKALEQVPRAFSISASTETLYFTAI